jgi:lipid-binding SYLF domain-containing protein
MPKPRVATLAAVLGLAAGAAGGQLPRLTAAAQEPPSQKAETQKTPVQKAPVQETPAQKTQAQETEAQNAEGQKAEAPNEQGPKNVTSRRQQIDAKAKETLDELLARNESARMLYDQAAGYAVFSATKAGFFVTGGSGTGVAVDKKTDHRTYMRMGSGGIGIGFGAQRYALVIFFQGQEQVDRFVRGGFNAKTTAEAAAGQAGASASSNFVEGVAMFQLTSKGLMVTADVSGTRFWPINELN